jgi:hypothetical protein
LGVRSDDGGFGPGHFLLFFSTAVLLAYPLALDDLVSDLYRFDNHNCILDVGLEALLVIMK